MTIINKTPHPINIVDTDNSILKIFKPDNLILRLSVSTEDAGYIDGIKLTKTVFGEPIGLPEYKHGVFYIVSQIVKSALPYRTDLLVPAEVVRDINGNIVGCKSLGV